LNDVAVSKYFYSSPSGITGLQTISVLRTALVDQADAALEDSS
jgi:hypothetical protein